MTTFRIATHKNSLALAQCDEVVALLPHVVFDLCPVDERPKEHSNWTANRQALQTMVDALLSSQAEMAVVPAIDIPYPLPIGIAIGALLPAKATVDALVALGQTKLTDLPEGAKVGVLYRRQLDAVVKVRPDIDAVLLDVLPEAALGKLRNNGFDALVMPLFLLDLMGEGHLAVEELAFDVHDLQGHLAVLVTSENKPTLDVLEKIDIRKKWGEVVIAGFGPGDPGLITRRAEVWLSLADVIVYDDLIEASYLRKYCADKIYVGKRKGAHYSQQDEINRTLHKHAVAGKRVVRIKGGDPLVFGRGAEEFHYLGERLVNATIVPGVSSAMAAAAAAVVPLTARGVSSSVVFLSGHNLDKLVVPKAETLVFFMGADNQRHLCNKLVEEGWSPFTPVAIVREASKPEQEVRRYTLRTLAEEKNPLPSPLVIIVGNSAGEQGVGTPTRWLFTGLNVADFKGDGICVHSPMIAIKKKSIDKDIEQILKNLSVFNRIIFPTRFAVQHFFDHLFDVGLDARALAGIEITAVGEPTSKALRQCGIVSPAVNARDYSMGLVEWFTNMGFGSEKILIPRSSVGLSVLPEGLEKLGHQVTSFAIYDTVMPDNIMRHNLDKFDGVMFTSPSTLENFMTFYGHLPRHLRVVVRGRDTQLKLGELNNGLWANGIKSEGNLTDSK
jgi:uroporphyrinogen III methyltransferase / synthase